MITINKKFTSVFFDMIQEEERYQQDRLETNTQDRKECIEKYGSQGINYFNEEIESAKKSLEMVHKLKFNYKRDSKFHCWIKLNGDSKNGLVSASYHQEFQEMLDNEMQYYSDYGHQAWTKEDKKKFKLIKEMVQDLLYQLNYNKNCGYERKYKHEDRFYNRFNAKPNENNNN